MQVETYGKSSDPLLVLVHGRPGGDYRSLLPAKAMANEGFFVIFYDQRGTGLSQNIAKILNVGLELNTSLGYYRPKWFLAVEAGVDHTLASKLKQGSLKENYPGIYEGWIGSTGGNFKFGAHVGHSLGKQLVSLRLGKVYARNFQDNTTLPFYFELALLRMN